MMYAANTAKTEFTDYIEKKLLEAGVLSPLVVGYSVSLNRSAVRAELDISVQVSQANLVQLEKIGYLSVMACSADMQSRAFGLVMTYSLRVCKPPYDRFNLYDPTIRVMDQIDELLAKQV